MNGDKRRTKVQLEKELIALRRRVAQAEKFASAREEAEERRKKIEHDIGERVKELQCFYGIAQLVERHGRSLDRLLQGIADLVPPSWQYPEVTCARVVFGDRQYASARFRRTRWRQTADIRLDGKKIGTVDVYYLKRMPDSDEGPFLKEERALIDAIAERTGRIAERLRAEEEIRRAHRELQVERTALEEANTALRTVLARIEEEKVSIKEEILANVDKILIPILHAMEAEAPFEQKGYVVMLKRNLEQMTSPFIDKLSKAYLSLTPAEIQVCGMIRNGLTSKEIAQLRHVSPVTVSRQRERIRKRLGITNKKVNLTTYLHAFEKTSSPSLGTP